MSWCAWEFQDQNLNQLPSNPKLTFCNLHPPPLLDRHFSTPGFSLCKETVEKGVLLSIPILIIRVFIQNFVQVLIYLHLILKCANPATP